MPGKLHPFSRSTYCCPRSQLSESSFQFFFVVYIDFIDVEFSVVFFCKLIEYRLQTFAIAAPGSMKQGLSPTYFQSLGLSSKFPTRCINSVFVNSIGVMLFPFIINKTKIVIIWLHCKWQYCLYSYQYSPSAGIK